MNSPRPSFWHWPSRRHICEALLLGAAVGLWFALIYGGADFVTAQHSYRVRLHSDWELSAPFWPESVLVYMSIYGLFLMSPFVLRTHQELIALATTIAVVIAVAGVCFLIFPADMLFPATNDAGEWTGAVQFAKRLALTYNLAPSLHVALSTICVCIYSGRAGLAGRTVLWLWALAIGASTILLHQHYILDVATGFALAWAGVHWIYDRRSAGPQRSDEAADGRRSAAPLQRGDGRSAF